MHKRNDQFFNKVNDQIRHSVVMVVQDGKNLGTFSANEAKKIAKDAGLDLVEIAPKSKPPVCRIMDYGKFRYEKSLKDKEKKKSQRQSQDKELRLGPSIGEHDLMIKINNARKFLEKGYRVRFSLQYKARENVHKELGYKVTNKIIQELSDVGAVNHVPKIDGRVLHCLIEPKK